MDLYLLKFLAKGILLGMFLVGGILLIDGPNHRLGTIQLVGTF